MTATLPADVQHVLEGATAVELVTVDDCGRPVVRSVPATYRAGEACVHVTLDEGPDPRVALLFCEEVGPTVLVQGTAQARAGTVDVRPERVYFWPRGADEPRLFDAHLEEVRSGHNEEPEVGHAEPEGGEGSWDPRLDGLQRGVLACIGPDGFPFAVQLDVVADAASRELRFPAMPVGIPVEPGPGCVHRAGGPRVHGDLAGGPDDWRLVPHAVLAG